MHVLHLAWPAAASAAPWNLAQHCANTPWQLMQHPVTLTTARPGTAAKGKAPLEISRRLMLPQTQRGNCKHPMRFVSHKEQQPLFWCDSATHVHTLGTPVWQQAHQDRTARGRNSVSHGCHFSAARATPCTPHTALSCSHWLLTSEPNT